jgi:hypothetical protein
MQQQKQVRNVVSSFSMRKAAAAAKSNQSPLSPYAADRAVVIPPAGPVQWEGIYLE